MKYENVVEGASRKLIVKNIRRQDVGEYVCKSGESSVTVKLTVGAVSSSGATLKGKSTCCLYFSSILGDLKTFIIWLKTTKVNRFFILSSNKCSVGDLGLKRRGSVVDNSKENAILVALEKAKKSNKKWIRHPNYLNLWIMNPDYVAA